MHLELAGVGVVAVEHGIGRGRAAGAFEQLLLGREVGLHGEMKIEMIAGEVGEDGGVKLQAVDAAEGERVGGHLHGGVSAALLAQLREEAYQLERFGRGIDGLEDAARQVILDGADEGGGVAGGAQHRIDQVRGGGFAVGAGDAGEPEAFIGISVKSAGGEGQRLAAVLDLHPATGQFGERAGLAGNGGGTARGCVTGEFAAVGPRAREGKEQEPLGDAPGIVIEAGDGGLGKLGRERLPQPHIRQQFAQVHIGFP